MGNEKTTCEQNFKLDIHIATYTAACIFGTSISSILFELSTVRCAHIVWAVQSLCIHGFLGIFARLGSQVSNILVQFFDAVPLLLCSQLSQSLM